MSLIVSNISPNVGPTTGGQIVTIDIQQVPPDPGVFISSVSVTFDGEAPVTGTVIGPNPPLVGATTIQVVTPPYLPPGSVNVIVTIITSATFAGTAINGYTYAAPTVTSVVPARGPTVRSYAVACNFQQCSCYNKCRKHQKHPKSCNNCNKIHRCPICLCYPEEYNGYCTECSKGQF